jgi:ABC-type polysaccharide/polyol phosphate export permease
MQVIRSVWYFFGALYEQRHIMGQLVRRDFQNRYLSSYIGLPWAFIQPMMGIMVIWFAFTYGLKVGKMETGIPFTIWFITGMLPWQFISESISSSTGSLLDYSFLIRKTSFRVAAIPFIKIFTAMGIHLVFVVLLGVMAVGYGFPPQIYWLQVVYLLFASFVLLAGLGWLLSALNVFVRDVGQVVGVMLSILFWSTPIMWPYTMLEGPMKYLALLNPFFYITEGYRYAFLGGGWIFRNVEMTVFFWSVALSVLVLGAWVFRKLNPHFADVVR